jgi:hypothetical protein
VPDDDDDDDDDYDDFNTILIIVNLPWSDATCI